MFFFNTFILNVLNLYLVENGIDLTKHLGVYNLVSFNI